MNNTVYDIDFTRLLPEPLKNDETMLALGKSIASELQENIRLAKLAIIYPRIDELDETTLDILARDLHVDWYNDAYPVGAKRTVIKSSVRVHKRLGTKFAVITAICDLYPNSEVQEWFEYGGTHHHFRILLDLTNAKAPPRLSEIIKAAKFYKRLSAHLDEIIYQMSAVIEISAETAIYRYKTGVTGKTSAGVKPYITTKGGAASAVIANSNTAASKVFESKKTGTKPYRSRTAVFNGVALKAEGKTKQYKIRSWFSGQVKAGEIPQRNIVGASELSGIELIPETQKSGFTSTLSGTKPKRANELISDSNSVSAITAAETFLYTTRAAGTNSTGTKPHINFGGRERGSGLHPTIIAETYFYRVKRCGTARCGK